MTNLITVDILEKKSAISSEFQIINLVYVIVILLE